MTTILELPEELLQEVFSFVGNFRDLRKLDLVNSLFKRVAQDNTLWKEIVCKENGFQSASTTLWKDLFPYVEYLKNNTKSLRLENDRLKEDTVLLTEEAERLQRQVATLKTHIDELLQDFDIAIEEKCRVETEIRTCKKIMDMQKVHLGEMKCSLLMEEEKILLEVTRTKDLSSQLEQMATQRESEKESHKILRKEVLDLREMWEREVDEVGILKREVKAKDKQLEKIEDLHKEKTKELERLQERYDKITKEERMKRVGLERRIEGLSSQLVSETENFKKQNEKTSKEKETLKKEKEEEYVTTVELKRRNRQLERELRRKSQFFECELVRMRNLMSKSNRIQGALSFVMAKA